MMGTNQVQKIFLFLFIESKREKKKKYLYTLRMDPLFYFVRDDIVYMHYCVCSKQFAQSQYHFFLLLFRMNRRTSSFAHFRMNFC